MSKKRQLPKNIKNGQSDTPLKAGLERDNLVIRIGIERLAWLAKTANGGPLQPGVRIRDQRQWASDVAKQLVDDDEVGNTLLGDLVNQAMESTMFNGSAALVWPEKKRVQRAAREKCAHGVELGVRVTCPHCLGDEVLRMQG